MANSNDARWHGDNYQSRFFWIYAARLRDPAAHVIEVTFEADAPRAFDDVVVRYDPPRVSMGAHRISVDHHQIKWHVTGEGRFGYEDLICPDFIHAKSVSLLQRLAEARKSAPSDAAFTLVTTHGIRDGDPLGELVSETDGSLRLDRLQAGKTPRSKMGKVRDTWRRHLGLASDEALYDVLAGFHILKGHYNLEILREHVNLRFRLVGLIGCEDSMEFRFDGAAKALKTRGINRLDRESFEALCIEEGWVRPDPEPDRQNISIRSFGGVTPSDLLDAPASHSLSLLDMFAGRHLAHGQSWEEHVRPPVEAFIASVLLHHSRFRLFLDAHVSIAFLAGRLLGPKTGATVAVVQKGLRNTINWYAEDGRDGVSPEFEVEHIGAGGDIALAVGLTHDVRGDVRAYLAASLPDAGKLIFVRPAGGPGMTAIAGGEHAARIADEISAFVVANREPGAAIHIFVAAPNAFSFMLGQRAERMGRCTIYEFDFGGLHGGSYQPAMRI